MTDGPADGEGSLLGSARRLAGDVGGALPRWMRRSREQVRFAASVLGTLGCGGATGADAVDPNRPLARVVELPVPPPGASERVGPDPDAPLATTLAIPDYDGLAASQVLPRLDGLSADELEAVRRYESAHRARRTVLGRIAQIQG